VPENFPGTDSGHDGQDYMPFLTFLFWPKNRKTFIAGANGRYLNLKAALIIIFWIVNKFYTYIRFFLSWAQKLTSGLNS
jgi:hypothetical protein